MKPRDDLVETGLFALTEFLLFGDVVLIAKFKTSSDTRSIVFTPKKKYWFHADPHAGGAITRAYLEDILNHVEPEIQNQLLFHLDLLS